MTTKTTKLLNKATLVVDKTFQAYTAFPVHRALTKVISERAECVDANYNRFTLNEWMELPVSDSDKYILSGRHRKILLPEIIRFPHLKRKKRGKVAWCRKNLWKRDAYRCQYCGKKPRPDEITVDHVIPRKQGGTSCFENCVLACLKCNLKKGDKTPEQAGMPLIRTTPDGRTIPYDWPIRPSWNPLFSMPKIDVFPKSWTHFLDMNDEELYWYVELEK